ncbi:Uncharacterised protein [uncultured archaeon]|nr:Uncharacterised protein [uncultured archaeon]
MASNMDIAKRALVTLVIERNLLDVSKPLYDKVIKVLKEEYNCYLPDCYEHPEYLTEILKRLYGNAYHTIVVSINKQLEEFTYNQPIANFLEVICK